VVLSYRQAVGYLESLIDYERSPAAAATARSWNLDRMRALLAQVRSPHQALRCAHIAGTKGKGSTAATLACILQAAGHRVGLYTSPHLVTMRERIRIDGSLIEEREVAELTPLVRDAIQAAKQTAPDLGEASFFEAWRSCTSSGAKWRSPCWRPAWAGGSTRPT
jgi:dihydrofolate synthase/folylpolyglutamate synthase